MQLKKLFIIALKDLKLIFRDLTALILMLLAPYVLSLGMGALTGRFTGGGSSGLTQIPLAIVNQDEGVLGEILVEIFSSPSLEDLISPQFQDDFNNARSSVDSDQLAAAILIPSGFTESAIGRSAVLDTAQVETIAIYANPTRPTSVNIIRSIVDQFIAQVEVGRVSSAVVVSQLLQNDFVSAEEAAMIGSEVGWEMAQNFGVSSAIQVKTNLATEEALDFDILAVMAPGMATMFLMFTVTYGARSLLAENQAGTLPRLLISPTRALYVLGGKFTGILFSAIAQLIILIGGTSIMFGLQWGDQLGVLLLILAAAIGATGWGILFAAVLKTPGQVAITGSAVMLLFGLLGGSFFQLDMLPGWLRTVSRITPNAWANEGFLILSLGGRLGDIQTILFALVLMGLILFICASLMISKRSLVAK